MKSRKARNRRVLQWSGDYNDLQASCHRIYILPFRKPQPGRSLSRLLGVNLLVTCINNINIINTRYPLSVFLSFFLPTTYRFPSPNRLPCRCSHTCDSFFFFLTTFNFFTFPFLRRVSSIGVDLSAAFPQHLRPISLDFHLLPLSLVKLSTRRTTHGFVDCVLVVNTNLKDGRQ